MRRTQLEEFGGVLLELIGDFERDIGIKINKLADETAEKIRADIEARSPVGKTGDYKGGWRIKSDNARGNIRKVIYNVNKPHLVHLLEFGHPTKLGTGRRTMEDGQEYVAAIPHVLPAYDKHAPAFYDGAKQILRGGA